jgi:hypothetical protein
MMIGVIGQPVSDSESDQKSGPLASPGGEPYLSTLARV